MKNILIILIILLLSSCGDNRDVIVEKFEKSTDSLNKADYNYGNETYKYSYKVKDINNNSLYFYRSDNCYKVGDTVDF